MKYAQLLTAIDTTSQHLVGRAAAAVNQALVIRNWLIGAYIVEFEQHGEDRAKYGQRLCAKLAADLRMRGAHGCGERMLQQMAHFYRKYPQFGLGIPQPVVAELQKIVPAIFGPSLPTVGETKKSSPLVRKSARSLIPQPLATEFVLSLSRGGTGHLSRCNWLISFDRGFDSALLRGPGRFFDVKGNSSWGCGFLFASRSSRLPSFPMVVQG